MICSPSIIIVDDNLIFRKGIKSILTSENMADVIGEASNGIEFIELLSHLEPDMVILDIDMPLMNGFEATKKALEIIPNLKIIVYTMFGNDEYAQIMKDLGVKAFMLKSSSIDDLERAILDAMTGDNNLSEKLPIKKSETDQVARVRETNKK